MVKYTVRFNSSRGRGVIDSMSRFDTRKDAMASIRKLKAVEMKLKGKLSPSVKSMRVVKVSN